MTKNSLMTLKRAAKLVNEGNTRQWQLEEVLASFPRTCRGERRLSEEDRQYLFTIADAALQALTEEAAALSPKMQVMLKLACESVGHLAIEGADWRVTWDNKD